MSTTISEAPAPTPVGTIGDSATFNNLASTLTHESAWLKNKRQECWDQFQELPLPGRKDERWRFSTRLSMDFNEYRLAGTPDPDAVEACIDQSELVKNPLAKLVFVDNHLVATSPIADELKEKGVIFESLTDGIQNHPSLIENYLFGEEAHLGSEKFIALHNALTHAGAVIYVPKGVELKDPLFIYHWTTQEQTAVFPHTLVIAEANSTVNVIDVFNTSDLQLPAFCSASGNIYAGAGAHVTRKVIQNWSYETASFQSDATIAARDSQVKTIAINLGGKRARFENQLRITEPGAHVTMHSLTVSQGEQEFDQRTFQSHEAPDAVSDLLYKNALLDESRTIFSGIINVKKDAQRTDAYQTNRNLLLNPKADANSLPGLEIQANDVKCSHGATTGQLESEELFYMMQRGIPKRVAQQLMVFGFFEEILEKFDTDEVRDNIRNLVQSKFHQ